MYGKSSRINTERVKKRMCKFQIVQKKKLNKKANKQISKLKNRPEREKQSIEKVVVGNRNKIVQW